MRIPTLLTVETVQTVHTIRRALRAGTPAPSRDDSVRRIDDDWKHQAKLLGASFELADLRWRVPARLSDERLQSFQAEQVSE